MERIKKDIVKLLQILKGWVSEEGMWYCFMDNPGTSVDTCATAGIAPARAKGYHAGLLTKEMLEMAKSGCESRRLPDSRWLGRQKNP